MMTFKQLINNFYQTLNIKQVKFLNNNKDNSMLVMMNNNNNNK